MADENDILRLINKIAAEEKFEKFEAKITPVSSGGANFSSKLYQVRVSSDGKPDVHMFAKAAVIEEKMRSEMNSNLYNNEQLYYSKVLGVFRELEDSYGIPEANRLKLPKYYGAESKSMQEILVLEDLTKRGFGSANRFKSVDWSYAEAAFTELAKFHVLSMALKHHNPKQYEKITRTFRSGLTIDGEVATKYSNKSAAAAIAAVRIENKQKLKMFLEGQTMATYYRYMLPVLTCEVLAHGDFRPSNMLHRVIDEKTTELMPIDYQTLQVGSPVFDIIYFIFTATDGPFRAKYMNKLIDHYHSELGLALARFSMNVKDKYSRGDLQFEMKKKLQYGLTLSVMLLPVLMMSEDEAPAAGRELDVGSFGISNQDSGYPQRLNEVVDDFVEWGIL